MVPSGRKVFVTKVTSVGTCELALNSSALRGGATLPANKVKNLHALTLTDHPGHRRLSKNRSIFIRSFWPRTSS